MDIVTIFLLVSSLLIELCIITLYILTKPKVKEHGIVIAYIVYTFISVTILNLLFLRAFGNEYLGYRIFTIVEGSCLLYYLYQIIAHSLAKKLIIGSAIFFVGFSLFDLFTNRGNYTFDSVPTVIECLLIICFSIFYFYEQLKSPQSLFLYSTPNFWIVVAFIIFFAGNFFIFIYGQSNSDSPEFQTTFSIINTILSFIENILFLIAFIIARKQAKAIKTNTVAKTS